MLFDSAVLSNDSLGSLEDDLKIKCLSAHGNSLGVFENVQKLSESFS